MKLFVAIFAWFDSVLLDIVSSKPYSPDFPESNPFWRHSDGSLWLSHAVTHSAFQGIDLAIASWLAWLAGSCIDRKYGRAAAVIPWAYYAFEHLDAAVSNFLIYLHLYVGLNG